MYNKMKSSLFSIQGNNDGINNENVTPRSYQSHYNDKSKQTALSLLSLLPSLLIFNSPKEVYAAGTSGGITVLGSGGKTGKLIVEGLQKSGNKVKPTYRGNPPMFSNNDFILEPAKADVKSVDSLVEAISGSSAVIFAASASSKGGNAKEVDYLGVENTAAACIKAGVPRLVVISSAAVTKPNSLGYKITNLFGNIMDYKLQGETAMAKAYAAAPDLGFVVIRPGGLTDGTPAGATEMELNQGDTIAGEVKRSDVAEAAIAAALSKNIAKNVVFELYEKKTRGQLEGKFSEKSGYEQSGESYEMMFKGLKSGISS